MDLENGMHLSAVPIDSNFVTTSKHNIKWKEVQENAKDNIEEMAHLILNHGILPDWSISSEFSWYPELYHIWCGKSSTIITQPGYSCSIW